MSRLGFQGRALALLLSLGLCSQAFAQPGQGAVSKAPVSKASEKPAKSDVVVTKGKPAAGAAPKKAEPKKPERKAVIVPGIHCPNGALEDPHRGFVRCLLLEEKGAAWLPPAPQPEPKKEELAEPGPAAQTPSNAPSAPSAPTAEEPPKPPSLPISTEAPSLEIKPPKFENGDVPAAERALNKVSKDIVRCIAEKGGLQKATGSLKIQFLVRAQGKAEGVEVLGSQGISAEAGSCVQKLLKNRSVGHPSSDPVGVTVVFAFTRK